MSTALAIETRSWGPATINPFPRARRRHGSTSRQAVSEQLASEGGEVINLADVLERAVDLNLNTAMRCDVRLHCYCLDELPVYGDERALLSEVDAMLAYAVSNAVWGSRVTCEAEMKDGRVALRVWFARPASNPGSNDWAIADGELLSSWPIAAARF